MVGGGAERCRERCRLSGGCRNVAHGKVSRRQTRGCVAHAEGEGERAHAVLHERGPEKRKGLTSITRQAFMSWCRR
ncbi:hypothetical protein BVI434_1120009 [Burkholderia vietnamiensis]|nr:hypothetical protein BVI434_1120009 [Burkholderia vietnamiensis]